MALRLKSSGPPRGKFAANMTKAQEPVAFAATMAFRDGARMVERIGRAEIARAGFSKRWQTGFKVFGFPRRQFSLDPAIKGIHTIGFANVFERGASIRGNPLLWIPLPSAPAKIAGKRTTVKALWDAVGGLHLIKRPGKPPLLAGRATRAPSAGRAITIGSLRTGNRRRGGQTRTGKRMRTVSVPLFVGVRAARIASRFDVSRAYDVARRQLGELYLQRFREANK